MRLLKDFNICIQVDLILSSQSDSQLTSLLVLSLLFPILALTSFY